MVEGADIRTGMVVGSTNIVCELGWPMQTWPEVGRGPSPNLDPFLPCLWALELLADRD